MSRKEERGERAHECQDRENLFSPQAEVKGRARNLVLSSAVCQPGAQH